MNTPRNRRAGSRYSHAFLLCFSILSRLGYKRILSLLYLLLYHTAAFISTAKKPTPFAAWAADELCLFGLHGVFALRAAAGDAFAALLLLAVMMHYNVYERGCK